MTAPLTQTAKPRKDVTRTETYIVTRWKKILQVKGTTVIGPALALTVHQPRNPAIATTIEIGTKPNVEWFMSMAAMLALPEGTTHEVNWTITANCMPSPFGGHSYKILTASEVKVFSPWTAPHLMLPAPRPPLLLAAPHELQWFIDESYEIYRLDITAGEMPGMDQANHWGPFDEDEAIAMQKQLKAKQAERDQAPAVKENLTVAPTPPSGVHWSPARFGELPVEVQRRFAVASERLNDQMLAFLLGEKPNYDKESQAISDFDHAIRTLGRDCMGFEKRKMEVKPELKPFAPIKTAEKPTLTINPNRERAEALARLLKSIAGIEVLNLLGPCIDVGPFRFSHIKNVDGREGFVAERNFPRGWLDSMHKTFYEGEADLYAAWSKGTDEAYAAAETRMKRGTTHELDGKDRDRKHRYDKRKALR